MAGVPAQNPDPDYRLPSRRKTIWEHYGDVRAVNMILFVLLVLTTLLSLALGVAFVRVYSRPPYILTEDEGHVMFRSTSVFRLRKDVIRRFLRDTLQPLLSYSPGNYDLSDISTLLSPSVAKFFEERAKAQSELFVRENKQLLWRMYEVRRSPDKNQKFIKLIVRGEMTTYQTVRGETHLNSDLNSEITLYQVWLEQIAPSPDNPAGLILSGLNQVSDPKQSVQVWESAVELGGTLDTFGKIIEPEKINKKLPIPFTK